MSNEIAQNVRSMANDLKSGMVVNTEKKRVEFDNGEDVFAKYLPEGLDLDKVKEVQSALIDYSAAQTLAFGEVAQEAMQKDKELTRLTTKQNIGYSAVESSYSRKRSGVADGVEWAKYGVASTDLVVGVGRKAAPYKQVVNYLGEEAKKVFAN